MSKRLWTDLDYSTPNSFWLVGDDHLTHSTERGEAGELYAHLVHSLLYNPRLMISDSIAINNPNLRHMLQSDGRLKEIITPDTLAIAHRVDESGNVMGLVSLRDKFLRDGKLNPSMEQKTFLVDEDLQFLQLESFPSKYSLKEVSQRYSGSTMSLLRSELAHVPKGLADRLFQCAEDSIAKDGMLQRTFFYNRLPGLLSPAEMREYGGKLRTFGSAHYLTALPDILGAQPIFPTAYTAEWSLLRRQSRTLAHEPASALHQWETKLPLAGYVQGLSRLLPEDLFALRDHNGAYGAFLTTLADYALGKTTGEHLARELIEYEQVIVDRVVSRFPEIQSTQGPRLTISAVVHDFILQREIGVIAAALGVTPEIATLTGAHVEVTYARIGLGIAIFGIMADALKAILSSKAEKLRLDTVAERKLTEEKLLARLSRSEQSDFLRVKGRVDVSGLGDQIYLPKSG